MEHYIHISAYSTTDIAKFIQSKGFPDQYGLFKIDNEICISIIGLSTNTFTGVVRGESRKCRTDLNQEELFEETSHDVGSAVHNLSFCSLKEFYRKLKLYKHTKFRRFRFLFQILM